ncbi:MAG: domain, G-beta repeat [Ignavibacteria bacterium]|nr:domain, G-beta repeat [Ignavibacteria bacterium]
MKKLLIISLLLSVILIPAKAQLQSDQSDSLWAIVMPIAASTDVDMKQVLVGNVRDSLVGGFVRNIGGWKFRVDSIYFQGPDYKAFKLVSGFPKYIVEKGDSNYCEFRFIPTKVGMHQSQIVIITQADTLYQNIQGEGVQPQIDLIADIIDFGKVEIGEWKDTLQAVTIKNGSAPLTINYTKHNKPNDLDFTTITGGGQFTMIPGETKRMDLRFKPGDVGRTSGTLEFHYNGVGSPAVVQLFGEGIARKNPIILSGFTALPDLICKNNSNSELVISNKGGNDLIVNDIKLKGTNPADFSYSATLPITIKPDSTKKCTVSFKPTSIGQKNAVLEIYSNAVPDSLITISLTAKKDSISLIPQTFMIDIGFLCPDETKDTTLIIRNAGTLKSGAKLKASGNIIFSTNPLIIDTAQTGIANIHFNGLSTTGRIDETISVTDTICGNTSFVKIVGEVILPEIHLNDVSIVALVGASQDGKLRIDNTKKTDVILNSAPTIPSPFSFTGNPYPITIPAGKSVDVDFRYTPPDLTPDTISITFNGQPCNINASANIFGIPALASVTLKTDTISAYPGDIIEVPIILENQKNLNLSGATSLNMDFSYNSTLLWSVDYPKQVIDESTAKITIEKLAIDTVKGRVLTKIKFKVGLGNSDECDLKLSNGKVVGGLSDIQLISGKFRLLGVCREGGARLVNPQSQAGRMIVSPNPAEDIINFEFSLSEKGYTEIGIYNFMGQKQKVLFSEYVNEFYTRNIKYNLSELNSGKYWLLLKTPTYTESIEVIIIK